MMCIIHADNDVMGVVCRCMLHQYNIASHAVWRDVNALEDACDMMKKGDSSAPLHHFPAHELFFGFQSASYVGIVVCYFEMVN